MNRFYPIDLSSVCNHKLIYNSENENEEMGLDGIYIDKKDFHFGSEEIINGVPFKFSLGKSDNIVCERQIIPIGFQADKIHIIGFFYWGNSSESFSLKYGNEELRLHVPLPDWSQNANDIFQNKYDYMGVDVKIADGFLSSGKLKHIIYFHHLTEILQGDGILDMITLPDNMFMHIVAITLEKNINSIIGGHKT